MKEYAVINKMLLCENKILKIANALVREFSTREEIDQQRIIYSMESYIKAKGLKMKGPIISYSSSLVCFENGRPIINKQLIMQLSEPLIHCDSPYFFKSIIRTDPCLFVRFNGNPQKLNFAFAKIGVFAFENDIDLVGSSYTIVAAEDEENAVIDVFMPKKVEGDIYEAVFPK